MSVVAQSASEDRDLSSAIFGLPLKKWPILLFASLVFVILLTPRYFENRFWLGAGVFFSIVVFSHLCLVSPRYLAFPGLISFAACLQWILAPWWSEFYPSPFPQYTMIMPVDEYLQYAVPATILLWLGLHLPMHRALQDPLPSAPVPLLSPSWRRVMDGLIIGGIILDGIYYQIPERYSFLFHILSNFRFFAVLAWMISGTPGWRIRLTIVLLHLTARATEQTLFYHLIHWGGYALLLYGSIRRWRLKLGVALLAAALTLGLFQIVKLDYREYVDYQEHVAILDRLEKIESLCKQNILDSSENEFRDDVGYMLVRFNQGWIISRIMDRVPSEVPYAEGQTLIDAAQFSLIPRALEPNKPEGTSSVLFAKYTGIQLQPGTAMGLSVVGELYANFGRGGALAATFAYALMIGFLFLKFFRLSQKSPLWWAVMPIILLPAVDPGWNIEDISNNIVKAGFVVSCLVFGLPPLRRLLGLEQREAKPDQGAGRRLGFGWQSPGKGGSSRVPQDRTLES